MSEYWLLTEVIILWYTTNYGAQAEAWSIKMAK